MPLRAPRAKPIVVGYDRGDMDLWANLHYALGSNSGRRAERPRYQMAFGYGMFTGGFGLHMACSAFGCMIPLRVRAIPTSDSDDSRLRCSTVLVATPSYAMHVRSG